jgi:hypothetical protein
VPLNRVVHFSATVALLVAILPAGFGGDNPTPPPVALRGARSVSIRDTNGGLQRFTTIPSTSRFVRYRTGTVPTCSFTASRDNFLLSNGTRVPRGTRVTSNYLFFETLAIPFHLPPAELPADLLGLPGKGPIANARRTFSVFCDRTYYDVNFVALISVPFTDALFTPFDMRDQLYQQLHLQRPVVFTNPVVDTFGGLVTRYPSWLAIEPDAWRTQQSAPITYRGLVLLLIAQPKSLDFIVEFTPDPDKPSPPFRGIIGCVPAVAASGDGAALPALPVLPEQAEPGPGGPCIWTPPGPGTVSITARITYGVTFWASGYTQAEPDYAWTSEPAVFVTGDLTAVNTDPTG